MYFFNISSNFTTARLGVLTKMPALPGNSAVFLKKLRSFCDNNCLSPIKQIHFVPIDSKSTRVYWTFVILNTKLSHIDNNRIVSAPLYITKS